MCCLQRYPPNDCQTHRQVIDDSIICAGSTVQAVGICFGDSGGTMLRNKSIPEKKTLFHFISNMTEKRFLLCILFLLLYTIMRQDKKALTFFDIKKRL